MTSYLAADDSGMDRRSRGLHRFLVSSPVVLLIAISAVGHLRKPAHLGAAGTADYDRRVMAYRDRVVAADRLTNMRGHGDFASLQSEAKNWADGFQSGQLTPLIPVAYEDHLRDGVRGEILTSGLRLSSQLSFAAKKEFHQGNYAQAANASLLAAETVYGMRGFELEAYLLCVHSARHSLDTVKIAWPHLSAQQRLVLKPRLDAMRIDPQEQVWLAERDDQLLRDYVSRQGRQNTVARQNPLALAKAQGQRTGTAARITGAYNKDIAGIIGPLAQS